ncbi:MAG: hypothetical protein H6807_04130 [Planctomycetes bacterium]|nr:hypothetical protein [Planctomycetota bacterium]
MRAADRPRNWRAFFRGQALQAGIIVLLLILVQVARRQLPATARGEALGLASEAWLLIGLAGPLLHQSWVFLFWRGALVLGWTAAVFPWYRLGFSLFAFWRVAAVFILARANRDTLPIDRGLALAIALPLVALALWLIWSVLRHFGLERAAGGDHFFPRYRSMPLCREGIFRYQPNAMYSVGFLALWAPAIAWCSQAALLLAAFNHAAIWAHYLGTEKPDLEILHGAKV